MILALLLACADPDAASSPGWQEEAPLSLDGYCPAEERWGGFSIDANEEYAYVSGAVADGVVPLTVLTELRVDGECTLWRRENPWCEPACTSGYTCDFDGTCIEYPTGQDLGTVGVEGLLQPVEMEPVLPGYTYFDTSLPNPPWEPGAAVRLTSAGGAWAPFSLDGLAPEPLNLEDLDWTLTAGQALSLAWIPASDPRTAVRISAQIDQHGNTPATVICWMEDDGAGEIPAETVDALLALGVSGFPNGTAARISADRTVAGEGCVDLWLSSSLVPTVSVAGYTPCTSDDDCPEGLTCEEELERCA